MKLAGVVIDSWTLPIFEKHLKAANFEFKQLSLAKNMLLLQVEYEWLADLKPVIDAAQKECLI